MFKNSVCIVGRLFRSGCEMLTVDVSLWRPGWNRFALFWTKTYCFGQIPLEIRGNRPNVRSGKVIISWTVLKKFLKFWYGLFRIMNERYWDFNYFIPSVSRITTTSRNTFVLKSTKTYYFGQIPLEIRGNRPNVRPGKWKISKLAR